MDDNFKVNKSGQTLEEFLTEYDPSNWAHPSYTADAVIFSDVDGKASVLLVKRGNHPYIGDWALPGGFVEEGETSETAVERELWEEAGITGINLDQLCTVSTPQRDPRGWTVTTVYLAAADSDKAKIMAGDDAADAAWFAIDYVCAGNIYKLTLTSGENILTAEMDVARTYNGKVDINNTSILAVEGIAFDHAKLLLMAIQSL